MNTYKLVRCILAAGTLSLVILPSGTIVSEAADVPPAYPRRKGNAWKKLALTLMLACLLDPASSHAQNADITKHPASGGVIRLHNDHGGLLTAYRDRFIQARENGERVVIDGMCMAACTLAVGLLPRGRVCVTPQAVLGFQSAWKPPFWMTGIAALSGGRGISEPDRIPNARATQVMMNIYPPVLQQWINQHGGLTPKLIYLRGKELAAIVPKC